MFLKMWLCVLLIGEGRILSHWDTQEECEKYREKKLTREQYKKTSCMTRDIN